MGFERSVYTTTERSRRVTVCVHVSSPTITCPSSVKFSVRLFFQSGTAGNATTVLGVLFNSYAIVMMDLLLQVLLIIHRSQTLWSLLHVPVAVVLQ